MLVKSVFMEVRSRLCSCNVFITTDIDFKKNCNLKISINSNSIVLNHYSNESFRTRRDSLSSIESLSDLSGDDYEDDDVTTTIPIHEHFNIIPNSMSGLKIEQNNITFRILTEAKNGGSFYKEILGTNQISDTSNAKLMKVELKVKEDIELFCYNCKNVISNGKIRFDRVLELPTSNMDSSEWFCHNHGHTADTTTSIKNNETDFLYRLTFFVLNPSVLNEKTNKFNQKRDIYHCNRCLAWLGIKTKDTVKLYNSTVRINSNGNILNVFRPNSLLVKDVNLNDFMYTIDCLMKEFNLGLQYTLMFKLVLECSVSTTKKQYMLLWIMDKELKVLENIDQIQNETVKLKSKVLAKILYKIEDSLNEEVETWIADPTVVSSEIAKSMFYNGLDHLNQMSMMVPERFRHANGFNVSYLKVCC